MNYRATWEEKTTTGENLHQTVRTLHQQNHNLAIVFTIFESELIQTVQSFRRFFSKLMLFVCYFCCYIHHSCVAVIPRQTIFYDIMDFLYHKNMSERLKEEIPLLAKSPVNADMELRHIEVSKYNNIMQVIRCTMQVNVWKC